MEENTVRTIKNNTLLKKYLTQSKLLFGVELYTGKLTNKNKIDLILVSEVPNYNLIEQKTIDWKYEKLINNIISYIILHFKNKIIAKKKGNHFWKPFSIIDLLNVILI